MSDCNHMEIIRVLDAPPEHPRAPYADGTVEYYCRSCCKVVCVRFVPQPPAAVVRYGKPPIMAKAGKGEK